MGAAFYPPSWYAASLDDDLLRPSLEGELRAHVCVIGGGYTGLSAAIDLAEKGYSVILLEARRIGWGASGRNGGQMIHGISGLERMKKHWGRDRIRELDELAWEGNRIIRRRVEKYRIDCDLKDGWIEAAVKPRHMKFLEQEATHFEATGQGNKWELYDATRMREVFGTDRYIGGLVNSADGHLHPLKLARGEAVAAEKLGVRIFEASPVDSIVYGDRVRVQTPGGQVIADHVIVAANIHHHLEGSQLSGLAFPAGSFIMATEPLSADFRQRVNPENLALCDANNVIDYFRYSSDGRLLFGGRCNYSGRKPPSIARALLPRLGRIWPELADVRIDYEWGGKLGVSLSRNPLIGRTSSNVWYANAYTGHGVNVGHLAGVLLSEAIAGQMERFDLFAKMPRRRLPLGDTIGREIISMAMFWYRLRDML